MSSPQSRGENSTPQVVRKQARVRTSPKLAPFFIAAAFIAFTAAVLTAYTTPPVEGYTRTASVGNLTLIFAMPAIAVAATAYLVTEKLMRRRASTYDMARAQTPNPGSPRPEEA